MKGINIFCINFQESLPTNHATLKSVAYLEVAFENTKYHHQDGGIPNIGTTLVLLDHVSRTDERDQYILYKLSGRFAHKLHFFKVGHLPRIGN
jgi:hypothetical protein